MKLAPAFVRIYENGFVRLFSNGFVRMKTLLYFLSDRNLAFPGETSNMTGVGEQSPSLSQDMPAMMTQVNSTFFNTFLSYSIYLNIRRKISPICSPNSEHVHPLWKPDVRCSGYHDLVHLLLAGLEENLWPAK